MGQRKNSVQRAMLLVCAPLAILTAVFAVLFVEGILTPRLLAAAMLLLMGAAMVVLTLLFRRSKPTARELNRSPKRAKSLRNTAVVWTVLLALSLFASRHAPLAPRLVGGSINILIICGFVAGMQAEKKRSA